MAFLTSVGPRPLWIGLLVVLSVLFSLASACAMPLAAFAAIAALTISRRHALALIGSVWLANQIAGFAIHHYPLTSTTFAWGAALGGVAIISVLAALWAKDRSPQRPMIAATAAFLAAFAVCEVTLFTISAALASGASDYTLSIVGRIFAINAAAFVALFLVHRLGVFTGFASEHRLSARA